MNRTTSIACRCRIAFLILAVLSSAEFSLARTWTDATGKHTIEAEFVSLESGTVTLKKADDEKITLPLEKLSSADQEFAKSAAAKADSDNPFASSKSAPPADKQPIKGACRVLLTISETGDCTFQVAPQFADQRQRDMGSASEFVTHDDGTKEFKHVLETEAAVDAIREVAPINIGFDPAHKAMLMTPNPAAGGTDARSGFAYPKLIRFPVEVEIDFARQPSDGNLIILFRKQGTSDDRSPLFFVSSPADISTAKIKSNWISSRDSSGKPIMEDLLKETLVNINDSKKFEFRLSGPNVVIKDLFQIRFALFGQKPATVPFILVRAKFAPLVGIGWNKQEDLIFVKNVIGGSLAQKAGVRTGDVLVSVNGQTAKSIDQAIELLEQVGFGDMCDLVVKRGEAEVKIPIKIE